MNAGAPTAVTSDWAGSPISTLHHLTPPPEPIPVEQYPDGASYVVRFEVPGVKPADLAVTVENGHLMVRAERRPPGPPSSTGELRYGSFARSITLPPGAEADAISATYHGGILTVVIGLAPEHQRGPTAIPIAVEP